jgi:hypothetical protein
MEYNISALPQDILKYSESLPVPTKNSFKKFLENIPNGQTAIVVRNMFKKIVEKPDFVFEFFEKIHSLGSVRTIKPEMYETEGSLGDLIFNTSVLGLGKGELLVAWLVKNAYIQGGTTDYDVQVKDQKFEIKNYRKLVDENGKAQGSDKQPIRLGVKGKVIKFEFWAEILETIRRIKKTQESIYARKNLKTYFDSMEIHRCIDYILEREEKILDGEFGIEDYEMFEKFYIHMNAITYEDEGFTHVVLRGPNVEPMSIAIEDMPRWVIEKYGFALKESDADDFLSQKKYIVTELRRLKYVRNPEDFKADIDDSVKGLIGETPFVIFRDNSITVTKNLEYSRISQGTIYLIESSLVKN